MGRIEHLVVVAAEVALAVHDISLQLFAVVTEVKIVIVETVLRQLFLIAVCIKDVDKILCF